MNGRKRHIAVDALGLLLAVVITAASVQDRDAARPLLWNLHRASRRVRLIWADAVYTAASSPAWAAALKMTLQIVARRNPHAFEVLPRRWVVERTFAWISKHRRTVRDYETPARQPRSHDLVGHDRPHGPPPGPARPFIKHSLSQRFALLQPELVPGTDGMRYAAGPAPVQPVRVKSAVQLVSQVWPLSSENACSHRAVVAVMSDHL